MLKIIFLVATIGPQGPVTAQVPDKARFADEAQCNTFGEHMNPRMADWVRGRLNADWDHPVQVFWRCETAGDPV